MLKLEKDPSMLYFESDGIVIGGRLDTLVEQRVQGVYKREGAHSRVFS